jgi:hypothetical protein
MDREPTRRRERPSSVHPAAESVDRSRQGAGSKCGPCRSCWQGAKPPAGIIEYPSDTDFNISTDITLGDRDGGVGWLDGRCEARVAICCFSRRHKLKTSANEDGKTTVLDTLLD